MLRRDLVRSRAEAQHLIELGRVEVAGVSRPKASTSVDGATLIKVAGARFASRAGEKLDAALGHFGIAVDGKRALDVGASTGGFTDCLLKWGASEVVALDVGHGQLSPVLRSHPHVRVLERLDVRDATPSLVGGPFEVIVADVSFVSLCTIAPALAGMAVKQADIVALVKPQFEVGRKSIGRGVVTDPDLRNQALAVVKLCFDQAGLDTVAVMESPLTGARGNLEYLLWARPA
ncbi:MAG: TlyA family RNA methyltransferase [Acidimicrobiia bacterium]